MTNIAIIGCGAIYQNHANAIKNIDGLNLFAVCDIDENAAKSAAELYNCKYYTDYKEMLSDEKIDCVHICTPHYLHSEMAVFAMEAGKDVLTEKPLCINMSDTKKMQEAAEKTGRRLGVCFQNRYNETSQKAKALLDSGKLGKVIGAKALFTWNRDEAYYAQAAWRGTWEQEGGGVLINQSIHTLDLLQWMLGDIESVSAHIATRKLYESIEVEDTADAYITFKSGAQCVFFASNCYPVTSRVEVEIVTDKGIMNFFDNELFWTENGGVRENLLLADSATGLKACWGLGHETLIRDFYEKRDKGESFPIDGVEGAKVIKLISTIYLSSAIGRKSLL